MRNDIGCFSGQHTLHPRVLHDARKRTRSIRPRHLASVHVYTIFHRQVGIHPPCHMKTTCVFTRNMTKNPLPRSCWLVVHSLPNCLRV
uniref:Uncharacterized protein n=1 Tax=Hyaloperonospora arabidopsidis (strain Emoy2) TaxID=559515 RepID=M4B7Q6_HYAAE